MTEWEKLEPIHNVNLQAHTRKQVQMYMAAKIIAKELVTKIKSIFTSYFATLDNEPIGRTCKWWVYKICK